MTAAPGFAPELFRDAMARHAAGVVIVTTHDDDGTPHGFTASSFCSVSSDPPLVLVCLAKDARCSPAFRRNGHFAVSILGEDDIGVARRFASKRPDKFADGRFVRTEGGAVVLDDAAAVLETTIAHRYDAGDHVILLGWVRHVTVAADRRAPAVYFDRAFHRVHPVADRV